MAEDKRLESGEGSKRKVVRIPTEKLSRKDVKEVFDNIYMSACIGLLTKYLGKIEFGSVSKKPKTKTKNPAFVKPKK